MLIKNDAMLSESARSVASSNELNSLDNNDDEFVETIAQTSDASPAVTPRLSDNLRKTSAQVELKTACNNQIKNNNNICNEANNNNCVTIIHFNDCYNIEPGKSSSGAAGFLTAINEHRHLNPMILFSGDILSPSFMSTFTKGEQMIPVLNSIKVDCAVFGNHEFDYGVDNLIDFAKRTNFPWLLSNAIDKETSNQLGDGQVYHIIEKNGLKFGLIGLIEEEWLSTLSTLEIDDVIYEDFVTRGRELAKWLKSELKVDYVIALTHFRTPNDIRLSDSVPEIDLILGGHDHEYEITKRPNSYIIKSGTDFREFSLITLKINPDYCANKQQQQEQLLDAADDSIKILNKQSLAAFSDIHIEHVKCIGFEEEPELKRKLEKFVTGIDEKMGQVLGQFNCDLDGRFSSIRKSETNLGNFVTDIMLASTHADVAILNSGTLRSDRIHPKGDFTMRDLFNILGYIDPIAVLKASGWHIWQALENGVSAWPKLEGRFPQVSGCSFVFDPSKPPMHRIDSCYITIGDEPLDLNKEYKLTTKAYLASGKDGYDMLKECQILVPGDESPDLTTSILNHFESIKILKSNRRTHHRQSVICLSRSSLKKIMEVSGQTTPETVFVADATSQVADNDELVSQAPALINNNITNTNNVNNNNIDNKCNININKTKTNSHFNATTPTDKQQQSTKTIVQAEQFTFVSPRDLQSVPQRLTAQNSVRSSPSPPPLSAATIVQQVSPMSPSGSDLIPITPLTPHRKLKRLMSLTDLELEMCRLEPKIEGRIRIDSSNAGEASN